MSSSAHQGCADAVMGCTSSKSARTREPSDKPEGAQREPSTEEESSQATIRFCAGVVYVASVGATDRHHCLIWI